MPASAVGTHNDPLLAEAKSVAEQARSAAFVSDAANAAADHDSGSKRPEETAFKQQRLSASFVVFTPKWMISLFLFLGVAFIVIGGVHIGTSNKVVEVTVPYSNSDCPIGTTCTIPIEIPTAMTAPIYMYYRLEGFYQNYRLYVKSRFDNQLQGRALDSNALNTACYPRDVVGNLTIYPCGFIAGSVFTDRFTACVQSGGVANKQALCPSITLIKQGIAWPTDMESKFIAPSLTTMSTPGQNFYQQSGIYTKAINSNAEMFNPSIVDEDLAVWMRTSTMPTFKKLHRIIQTDLKAGDRILFNATSRFDVSSFGGSKAIVLSTMSYIGGKHNFMAISYLVVGIVCLLEGIVFGVLHMSRSRKLGDLTLLNELN